MKIKYIAAGMIVSAIAMSSCSDFTEIDAKGKNLLNRTQDLELLLNADYSLRATTMQEVCGDLIYAYSPLSTILKVPVKTTNSIIMGWDEAGHDENLPELTASDEWYSGCYEYIGRIANPILSMVDAADGDGATKAALKAEAYVVRAYFHFLAVQKFAPAYNPATASHTVALSYVKEDQDIKSPTEPVTLDVFYDNIIADLDAADELDALPESAVNQLRFSKPCLYAIRALVHMSMQRYDLAAQDARRALDIKSTVADYNSMLTTCYGGITGAPYQAILRKKLECPEDYFADYNIEFYNTWLNVGQLEPGHLIHDRFNTLNASYEGLMDPSQIMIGVPGLFMTMDMDSSWPVIGLRSTQMYLVLAECAIGEGHYNEAMGHLDKIRVNRIDPSVYAPLEGSVNDKATAIGHLKSTALGENMMSVWSFVDKKRWTQIDDYKETYRRTLVEIDMTLTPESSLWVFPIPQNVINNNPNFKPYMN
ncbi:RagB/SusD family nutrient uptake outer membrane protein [Duncaniella freteri]|uniref:RagB/SusD family nutrient uptake outer membrane protein n=3 Tax=Duncaniella TaxID=2518495 RepID=UPI0025737981|nr:RagB/SusD family nutrient uptake outer membrane protein [Duncaniella freteri]